MLKQYFASVCVARHCVFSVLRCVAVCCSLLQCALPTAVSCVVVVCSVLQCARRPNTIHAFSQTGRPPLTLSGRHNIYIFTYICMYIYIHIPQNVSRTSVCISAPFLMHTHWQVAHGITLFSRHNTSHIYLSECIFLKNDLSRAYISHPSFPHAHWHLGIARVINRAQSKHTQIRMYLRQYVSQDTFIYAYAHAHICDLKTDLLSTRLHGRQKKIVYIQSIHKFACICVNMCHNTHSFTYIYIYVCW